MRQTGILIGTSGWSYPERDVGWRGVFYPGQVDELEFYSRHFDTVEVNSTFYRPATRKMAESWARRTPKHFRFSVKLWQKFTHPKMFAEAAGKDAVGDWAVDKFRKLVIILINYPK